MRGGRVYLLDRYLLPVPPAAAGEVYVSGECVTRGYTGQPAQTAAAFLPDPFRRGARMYRTGTWLAATATATSTSSPGGTRRSS